MRTIHTADDFDALMAEVDAHLQETGAPLPGRELRVASEVARRLSKEFPMSGSFDFTPVEGCYGGPSLMGHINRWLEGRYGDRLKVDFSLGYAAVSVRSDTWLMRVPLIFGAFQAVVERDLSITYPKVVLYTPGTTEKLTISVLPLLQDFPQGLASTLTDAEMHGLLSNFIESFETFRFLDGYRTANGLAMAAAQDLTQSAKKAAGAVDGYGMARWDALQAAEKAIKFLLDTKGVPFPKGRDGHSLRALVELAVPCGMSASASRLVDLVDLVQCDAGIRYERRTHRREDVVLAHRAATGIVRCVGHAFRAQPQQPP